MTPGRLELRPDQMRELGHRVVDMLLARFVSLRDQPAHRMGQRAALEAALREPAPEQGADALAVLDRLSSDVFPHLGRLDHPRFFAFVPSPGNFVSVMADALASGFNVFAGSWLEGSAAAELELVVVDWLRDLCGLPESAGGLLVSGGSVANLTALAVARHVRLEDRTAGAVVYFSDQTHSAVERALRVLGFLPEQFRRLSSDAEFRLSLTALDAAVTADRAAGLRPFCVVANAGTTNTGAVDPLAALADFCACHQLWLHVDGAYGAPAVLTARGRELLAGLGRADSLCLDPHKWLFQPFEIGCVLVSEEGWLKDAFRILPDYLEDVHRDAEEVNFLDRGIQLSRGFRALKLWFSIQVFGLAAFRQAVGWGLHLAEFAAARLSRMPGWQVLAPPSLGIVAFCYRPSGMPPEEADALNRSIAARIAADGRSMVSTTVLHHRPALRLCTINPRTSETDILETLALLDDAAQS